MVGFCNMREKLGSTLSTKEKVGIKKKEKKKWELKWLSRTLARTGHYKEGHGNKVRPSQKENTCVLPSHSLLYIQNIFVFAIIKTQIFVFVIKI